MEEAREVICAVNDLREDDPYVVAEMESIRKVIALEEHEGAQSWTAVFKKDILQTRKRVGLAWFGLFMNQLSGINLGKHHRLLFEIVASADHFAAVVYYLPTALSKFVELPPSTTLLIAGFIQL